METLIDKQRFYGSCYKAANWAYLGQTRGKGRRGMNYYAHDIIKDVYVYPLVKMPLVRKILKGINHHLWMSHPNNQTNCKQAERIMRQLPLSHFIPLWAR